jgi:hypothetical protein
MSIFLALFLIVVLNMVLVKAMGKNNKLAEEEQQPTKDVEVVDAETPIIVDEKPKQCPPHKWRYVEVRDRAGNTLRWKIICDLCGPLTAPERPSNEGV